MSPLGRRKYILTSQKVHTEIRENSSTLVQLNSVTNTLSADTSEGVRHRGVKLTYLKTTARMLFELERNMLPHDM
jgi:hypothetical protein